MNLSMRQLHDQSATSIKHGDNASFITKAYAKDFPKSKIEMLKELDKEGDAYKKANAKKK